MSGHTNLTLSPSGGALPRWSVGDRLAKARKHAGIGSQQMADKLGCSRTTISNYESERSPVPKSVVIAWSTLTRVPEWWIVGDDGNDNSVILPELGPDTDDGGADVVTIRYRAGGIRHAA